MNHEEIQGLLEGYVDESLDRATRREVDSHLAKCEECRAILDDVAPVELGDHVGVWDERGMRRAVRRSMLRVAVDALMLLFVGWLAAWALSLLILQPLVVNRGGRAVAATNATVDLGVMNNPGAVVTGYSYRSQWLSRISSVDLALPVGSAITDLGRIESRIGAVGFGDPDGGHLSPFVFDEYTSDSQDEGMLRAVDEGTVATAQLWFDPSLDIEMAQSMIGSPADVSAIWVGFDVADDAGTTLAPTSALGYGTCGTFPITVSGAPGSSGGGSGTAHGGPASVSSALEETRRALENLRDHPDLLAGLGASVEDATEALSRLASPQVAVIVVTGPTDEVIRFIEEVGPDAVSVTEVDFMNWSEPPCGR